MRRYVVGVTDETNYVVDSELLEHALRALGYPPPPGAESLFPDENATTPVEIEIYYKRKIAESDKMFAEAQTSYRELSVKYESCKANLAEVQTNMAKWRREANEAIDERIKTQQMNERLLGVMRQLHESAIKVVDVMSGGKP